MISYYEEYTMAENWKRGDHKQMFRISEVNLNCTIHFHETREEEKENVCSRICNVIRKNIHRNSH